MSDHRKEASNVVASAPVLDLERVHVVCPLGRGAKGVVFLVRDNEAGPAGGEEYALKVILRDLVEKRSHEDPLGEYKRVCFERQVLSRFNHPLLPRLRGVLSTDKLVGYAIDYCSGRDLNYLRKLQSEKMFSLEFIRFYAAELVMILEYLHDQGIAYRDLKPDNIMIQSNGHIMLVDFDLSTRLPVKRRLPPRPASNPNTGRPPRRRRSLFYCFNSACAISPDDRSDVVVPKIETAGKSNSFVGTEEYVAPEIIRGHWHDFAVDWWSLGVVLYEMLYGVTPFKGSNRKETFLRILNKEPDLVGEATPLRDLIRKLLTKDPNVRIELDGIKAHEFFRGVDWDSVLHVTRPPYIPPVSDERRNNIINNNNNKITDLEGFVLGIFGVKEDEKNINGDESKGLWVNGLSNRPREDENFRVF